MEFSANQPHRWFVTLFLVTKFYSAIRALSVKIIRMSKKTGFSDSTLWIGTIVLLVIAALTYFKK